MIKKFVHIDEPIALAMTLIPNSNSMDKAVARQWVYTALRNIGPGGHWFNMEILYPNANRSMKKPDDMFKAIDIALYKKNSDGNLSELRFSYKGQGKRIHVAENQYLASGYYAPAQGAPIDLSEDPYCFHLGSNGADVFCAKLKYLRLPVGSDGLPLIPEHQVLAIAMFIRWMWSMRENVALDRQLSKADWLQARNEARASDKMPSGIEMEQAAKEWTNLLDSPQFKQF